MDLDRVQNHLETIYGVTVDYRVDDFLITDSEIARRLDTSHNSRDTKEKLLVCQDGNNLDISLYIDADVIAHLAQENPFESLHNDNLTDYWIALEGVSHFLYLTWNAFFKKSVTLLELEMQAEVDKYISSRHLLKQQNVPHIPQSLRSFLFYGEKFDLSLDEKSLLRYRDANFYAGKYCFQLEKKFIKKKKSVEMYQELRRFYRLPQREKIRHILNNDIDYG